MNAAFLASLAHCAVRKQDESFTMNPVGKLREG